MADAMLEEIEAELDALVSQCAEGEPGSEARENGQLALAEVGEAGSFSIEPAPASPIDPDRSETDCGTEIAEKANSEQIRAIRNLFSKKHPTVADSVSRTAVRKTEDAAAGSDTTSARPTELRKRDNPHAPGCFGSALTYKEGGPECRECMFAAECAPLSAERRAELEKRLGTALSWDGAERARKARNSADYRARKRASSPRVQKLVLPIRWVSPTRAEVQRRRMALQEWLNTDGPRQRQYRKHLSDIMKSWVVLAPEGPQFRLDPLGTLPLQRLDPGRSKDDPA